MRRNAPKYQLFPSFHHPLTYALDESVGLVLTNLCGQRVARRPDHTRCAVTQTSPQNNVCLRIDQNIVTPKERVLYVAQPVS